MQFQYIMECKFVSSRAYPEPTQRLVDEELDFVFWEGASHLRQVSEHVRHHQVAVKKKETVAEKARKNTGKM